MGTDQWNIDSGVTESGQIEFYFGRMLPVSIHLSSSPVPLERGQRIVRAAMEGDLGDFVSLVRALPTKDAVSMGHLLDARLKFIDNGMLSGNDLIQMLYCKLRSPIARDAKLALLDSGINFR
jgi:hypothetical protein